MKLFTMTDDLKLKDVTRSWISWNTLIGFVCAALLLGSYSGYKAYPWANAPKVITTKVHTSSTDTIFADNDFSKEKFVDLLYEMNIKYPHIVMAQAIIESGNFSSAVFRRNNNMFGMRQARTRTTTSSGDIGGYASYRNWRDCVYDYALYQYSAMSTCDNEAEYFDRLQSRYAQDTSYVSALKATIKNQNLKSFFDE